MALRAKGWVQDPGTLENLIKVVELFDASSVTYKNLVEKLIPEKVEEKSLQKILLKELEKSESNSALLRISYSALVGKSHKPRSAAKCNGIIQALISGQKRPFISDWPANNFLRLAEALGFVKHDERNDSYHITKSGLSLSRDTSRKGQFMKLKDAFLQYPPIIRILDLLYLQYHNGESSQLLTKYELGKELGFRGENGFTTYPQSEVIQALVMDPEKARSILANWEGSSDKYARMICTWLSHKNIEWVTQAPKVIEVNVNTLPDRVKIGQSYKITHKGIRALRKARAKSRHKKIPKRVFFEMLATKGSDINYLRKRRCFEIQCLKKWQTLSSVKNHLSKKGIPNIPKEIILSDIRNFERIGLEIKSDSLGKYKIIDNVIELRLPPEISHRSTPSEIIKKKFELSTKIKNLDHSFFDLIDLGFDSRQNRLYELRIVELLNLIEMIQAFHLSGGNRPEIIALFPPYSPDYGIIMDSKSYKGGFNIPATERDKMMRYVNEYVKDDPELNPTKWWENLKNPDFPSKMIVYSFISGRFIGKFVNQLKYIKKQTGISGSAISSDKLIEKVDSVLDSQSNYGMEHFIEDLSTNDLVK